MEAGHEQLGVGGGHEALVDVHDDLRAVDDELDHGAGSDVGAGTAEAHGDRGDGAGHQLAVLAQVGVAAHEVEEERAPLVESGELGADGLDGGAGGLGRGERDRQRHL
ncbi:unannotated protein [freshwater metagenome]|uniref:Unannotated protein n=1 Tax=freshwater metagenome TaxID=449393 RepID=A0A6J6ERF3_9ZZZZ